MDLRRAASLSTRVHKSAQRQLSDSGFDDCGGDFAAAGLLNGVLPGELSLIRGESNQRADLCLVLRLLLTFSQQVRDLGCRDQAVDVVSVWLERNSTRDFGCFLSGEPSNVRSMAGGGVRFSRVFEF